MDSLLELRRKVINTATELALQETETTDENYTKVISKVLDEACLRHNVTRKELIQMFVR